MIRREDALEYHTSERAGKIEVRSTKPCFSPREARLAYLPGAAFPAQEIARDPAAAFRYTARGNLVALISDGTAVPGLGNVGATAAKPMLEGMAVLLKRLADLDVFDLELDVSGPDDFVETVRRLAPGFGAVNLKDIRAPEGLDIHDRLAGCLGIPVFHENLYGTAVVAVAALLNALDLVDKRVGDVRVVLCGAGTVGTGCARLLARLGVPAAHLAVYDEHGLVRPDRPGLLAHQAPFARADAAPDLASAMKGADVFVGASAAGVVTPEMVRVMAPFPIVFALATPEPEIPYETARATRRDVLVATGSDLHPNAVVDLLSVPYVFRGALDVEATRITEGMLLAAARALAALAREDVPEEVERAYGSEHFVFGPEYLLPKPADPRILLRESAAVAQQAIAEGVARRPLEPGAHEKQLSARLGPGRETLRGLVLRAARAGRRVVFGDGANETVLRACRLLLDEGIARPVLVGREELIRERIRRLDLELAGIEVVEPGRSPATADYAAEYFRMRSRRGVMEATAAARIREAEYFAAMMLHHGDADLMIAGSTAHYAESLRRVLEVIGPAPGFRRVSSHHLVILPKKVLLLADCAVNVAPDEESLAEIALACADAARVLGLEPRVAMLSFSNFGSVDDVHARRVREAVRIARERAPDLAVDGEMQLATALDVGLRQRYFPFARLVEDANVLVAPDLQSGSMALQLIQYLAEAVVIGPLLSGTRRPVHVLQYGASVEDVVNLVALGIVEAAERGWDDARGQGARPPGDRPSATA